MVTWTTTGTHLLMEVLNEQQFNEMNMLSSNVVWINDGRNTDLPSILVVKWRGREATNLRDKVFGLLGSIRHGTGLEFTTRYTCASSAADVYSAFTLDAIMAQNSLQPLVLDPRLSDENATADIPRWAMDLKGRSVLADALFYRDWAHDHYNACNGGALDQSFLRSTVMGKNGSIRILGVTGVMVTMCKLSAQDSALSQTPTSKSPRNCKIGMNWLPAVDWEVSPTLSQPISRKSSVGWLLGTSCNPARMKRGV